MNLLNSIRKKFNKAKMVGNKNGLMTIRLVRSKLRKREDAALTTARIEAQQTFNPAANRLNVTFNNNNIESGNANANDTKDKVTFVRTAGVDPVNIINIETNNWVFPPKAPTPNIYQCYKTETLDNDKHGFKGFRKQFSGRFKRLVKKAEPIPAIPPELKPQLKTIYVY